MKCIEIQGLQVNPLYIACFKKIQAPLKVEKPFGLILTLEGCFKDFEFWFESELAREAKYQELLKS